MQHHPIYVPTNVSSPEIVDPMENKKNLKRLSEASYAFYCLERFVEYEDLPNVFPSHTSRQNLVLIGY